MACLLPLFLTACIQDRFHKRKPETHILEDVLTPSKEDITKATDSSNQSDKTNPTADQAGNEASPKNKNTEKPSEKAQRISPFEIIGSGDFATDYSQTSENTSNSSGYRLDFIEADVRDVIHEVLSNVLGKNYFIDPSVNGPVTLVTNDPMSRDQVLSMLEAVLNANSLVLVQENNLISVLPASKAKGLGNKSIGSDLPPPKLWVWPVRTAGFPRLNRRNSAID